MMKSRWSVLVVSILCGALGACATTELSVEKVPPPNNQLPPIEGPKGIRYSLPKPFLLATPDPGGNGSLKVEVVYLPDECNTYAIGARTKRGHYDLTVLVKEGLLTKLSWTEKDAEVLAESLKTGGEILKAELERADTEKKEREKKAEDERKAAEGEVKALEKTLNDKQLEVNLAAVEHAAAEAAIEEGDQSDAAKKALRDAQLKLDKARAARDFSEQVLNEARSRVTAKAAAFNKDSPDATSPKTGANESLFWSPVLYAIDDTADAVRLRAVEWRGNPTAPGPSVSADCKPRAHAQSAPIVQRELLTSKPPKPPADPVKPPKVLGSIDLAKIWKQGPLRFTILLDKPVNGLMESEREISTVAVSGTTKSISSKPFQVMLNTDRQSIRVEFPAPPLPAGKYQIEIPFNYGDNKQDQVTFTLTIQR